MMRGLRLACKGLIFMLQLLLKLKDFGVMSRLEGASIGLLLLDDGLKLEDLLVGFGDLSGEFL
jgi:hypothetical protein